MSVSGAPSAGSSRLHGIYLLVIAALILLLLFVFYRGTEIGVALSYCEMEIVSVSQQKQIYSALAGSQIIGMSQEDVMDILNSEFGEAIEKGEVFLKREENTLWVNGVPITIRDGIVISLPDPMDAG